MTYLKCCAIMMMLIISTPSFASSEKPFPGLEGIIEEYRASLPRPPVLDTNQANAIKSVIDFFRPHLDEDEGEGQLLIRSLQTQLESGEALKFILPAFPFNSRNPKKVFGPDPGLGDIAAILRLKCFCDLIKEIYEPGAEILLVSDGIMCARDLEVTEGEFERYGMILKQLIMVYGSRFLSYKTLQEIEGSCVFGKD